MNENHWILLRLVWRLETLHIHSSMHVPVAFCRSSELPVEVDKESRAAAWCFVVFDRRLINHFFIGNPDRISLDYLDRHAGDELN